MKLKYYILLFSIINLIGTNIAFAQSYNLESAINKTKEYFNNNQPKSHQILIFLNYLERAYDIKFKFDTKKLLQEPPIFDDEKEDIQFFYRSFNKNYKPNLSTLDLKEDYLKMMVWSIYSDRIKLSKQYEFILNQFSKKEDKYLTHAAISLGWLIEQKQTQQLNSFQAIRDIQIQRLQNLIDKEKYIGDTGFEALVSLIMLGESSKIDNQCIAAICSAQLSDGGFQYHGSETNVVSNQHTTMLALWVMLDFENGGKRKDNFVTTK